MVNPKVPHIQAVLLVPTRELALQTSQVCRTLGKHLGLEIMVSTGGTGLKDDILRLGETVHLLIGTPGRVLDLSSKGIADLKNCKIFVMDEADKLLSPEFQPVMESLLGMCHPERQVMLFSATFPMLVKDFRVSSASQNTLYASATDKGSDDLGPKHAQTLRNQLDGRAHTARCDSILRLCRRTSESPLSQYPFFQGSFGARLCLLLPRLTSDIVISCKSTNLSFSVTLPTVSNSSPRRLPSSDTRASTLTPRCSRTTVTGSSTISVLVHAETSSVPVSSWRRTWTIGIHRKSDCVCICRSSYPWYRYSSCKRCYILW